MIICISYLVVIELKTLCMSVLSFFHCLESNEALQLFPFSNTRENLKGSVLPYSFCKSENATCVVVLIL